MPDKNIAIAILNWNGEKLLRQFLPSVLEHSPQAGIYVIDNASTDDSLRILREEFPTVRLIRNAENYGYAGGYNEGLKEIREEYIILLNSDVEVSANWLPPLLEHMEKNPQLAALQPKVLDYWHRHLFEYAGAAGGYLDKWAYPFCRGRIFYELEEDRGQYDSYHRIFWATGACMMIRNAVFREIGGFNPDLFAHMEEIDLCWRLQNQSWEIGCEPNSVVYHLGGGTLNKLSARKTFLNFRNNLIIVYQNTSSAESFRIIGLRLILDGVAAFKFLLDGQGAHFVAVMKAHFSFYRRFPGLRKNKKNAVTASLTTLPGVYPQSLVWKFFVSKKRKFSQLF